jgi:hypothetical protein
VFEILLLKEAVPALEDINNESVKRLAERLKGRSDKETLTNILEWQEKNIQFWADRWYGSIIFIVPVVVSSALLFVIFLASFLIALIGENSLILEFILSAIIVFVLTAITAICNLKIFLVILFIYYLPVTVLGLAPFAQNRIELTSSISVFVGAFGGHSYHLF